MPEVMKPGSLWAQKLAPWEAWGEWANSFDGEDIEAQGGMVNLTMRQYRSKREGLKGYVQAKIQPSAELSGNSGVFMDINNHYEVLSIKDKDAVGCLKVMDVLEEQWNQSVWSTRSLLSITS
ncbi:MAG: hypothetical protein U5L00_20050 [Desulfovermiculus sp.]|nr:hypothetical protein [Desulfovermiculus sp.]